MIKHLVRRDHPKRDVLDTRPLHIRDERRRRAYAYTSNATKHRRIVRRRRVNLFECSIY